MTRELDRRRSQTRLKWQVTPTATGLIAAETSGVPPREEEERVSEYRLTSGYPPFGRAESGAEVRGDYVRRALAFAQAASPIIGLDRDPEFLADPVVGRTSASARSVYLQYLHDTVPVFESTVMVRFMPSGQILDAFADLGPTPDEIVTQRGSARVAVLQAARHVASADSDEFGLTDEFGNTLEPEEVDISRFSPELREEVRDGSRRLLFRPGPFGTDIEARPIWFTLGTSMSFCWRIDLTMPEASAQYVVIVDAGSGRILYCRQMVERVAAAGYVYTVDGREARQLKPFPPESWDAYGLPFPVVGKDRWQPCRKCSSLFRVGGKGRCVAGGDHLAEVTDTYTLVINSTTYPGESGWRCCANCGCLYFGESAMLACTNGAHHEDAGRGSHVIQRDAPLSPLDHGWKQCRKCACLFREPAGASRCPVGGGHDGRLSGDYSLAMPSQIPLSPGDWVEAAATAGNSTITRIGPNGPSSVGTTSHGVLVFHPDDPWGDDQRLVNAHYFCCYIHDVAYLLGFRERERNFQQDNFGLGGIGGDAVEARVYSGTVPSTASMATAPEGKRSILKLGIVSKTRRHCALDATVVFHEYAHGITTRLVGGAANALALAAPQSAAMGEGWSDYLACTLCNVDVIASWALNSERGIRRYRYDSKYPDGFASLGSGRYVGSVHNVGEIWAAALLEMARRTDRFLALQLVIDALKLTRPRPNFLNGRDAILLALDQMFSARRIDESQRDGAWTGIWTSFAHFGMGLSAGSRGAELEDITADYCVGEHGWRCCQRCGAIYSPSAPASVCSRGGAHQSTVRDKIYDLCFDAPRLPGERNWRKCQRCGALFRSDGRASICPASGAHVGTADRNYQLIADAVGSVAEANWRCCCKCAVLYLHDGAQSACPGDLGRSHSNEKSREYFLIHH